MDSRDVVDFRARNLRFLALKRITPFLDFLGRVYPLHAGIGGD
jgi:hypothetical protein